MKQSFIFVFLFTIMTSISVFAYSDNRCNFSPDDLPLIQKGYEAILGKFKKLQKNCCLNAVKSACDDALIATACRMNVNQAAGSCPEECKQWASDCTDFVSGSEVRSAYE